MAEGKTIEYGKCPKCRKQGYYKSKEFYACHYCGYTEPDTKAKVDYNRPVDKLDHGTKPGGMRY
jgi:hypothetical protein